MKDLIDHLKTAHFTLVALGIGLIIASQVMVRGEVVRANADLDRIMSRVQVLPKTWPQDATVAEQGSTRPIPASATMTFVDKVDKEVAEGEAFTLRFQGTGVLLSAVKPEGAIPGITTQFRHTDNLDYDTGMITFKTIASLEDFENIWEFLASIHEITVPSAPPLEGVLWLGPKRSVRVRLEQIQRANEPIPPLRNRGRMDGAFAVLDGKGLSNKWGYVVSIQNVGEGVLETAVEPVPINMLKKFAVRMELTTDADGNARQLGSFEESFPALSRVTEHYRELPFGKAQAILHAELTRQGSEVELLGFKVPAAVGTTWGLGLLVVVQLYYLLHLSRLVTLLQRHPLDEHAIWLACYPDPVSCFLCFVSSAVLPPAVATYLLWSLSMMGGVGTHSLQAKIAMWVFWLSSLVLGTLSGRKLKQLRAHHPPTTPA